jgi:hypothetical protein
MTKRATGLSSSSASRRRTIPGIALVGICLFLCGGFARAAEFLGITPGKTTRAEMRELFGAPVDGKGTKREAFEASRQGMVSLIVHYDEKDVVRLADFRLMRALKADQVPALLDLKGRPAKVGGVDLPKDEGFVPPPGSNSGIPEGETVHYYEDGLHYYSRNGEVAHLILATPDVVKPPVFVYGPADKPPAVPPTTPSPPTPGVQPPAPAPAEKPISEELAAGAFSAKVEYPYLVNGTFLPALAHLCGQQIGNVSVPLVKLTLENKSDQDMKRLKIRVSLQQFSEETNDTVDLPAKSVKVIAVTPVFKERLSTLSEGRPGAIQWFVEDDKGQALVNKTQTIKIASRNDMILSQSFSTLAGVFVTPNDPIIDELISCCGVEGVGYQAGEEGVKMQARAIYDTLERLGVHYRSTCNSFLSQGELAAQRIYYPRECVQQTGANCIDGAILFASAFEKLGLRPYLVLVPGHCFVAVAMDPEGKVVMPLETTCLGVKEIVQQGQFGPEKVLVTISFDGAMNAGISEYLEHTQKKNALLVDISALRQAGVTPYPYYERLGAKDFSLRKRLGMGD